MSTPPSTLPPALLPTGTGQTVPAFYAGLTGLCGVVPRRGWDAITYAGLRNGMLGLREFVLRSPSRALALLFDFHPLFKRARANDLSLAFGQGDTSFVAVSKAAETNDAGETSVSEKIDSDATSSLDALWDSLPPWVGGMRGLQAAIYDHISCAGFAVVECVPGPTGTGLSLVQTADPNTFRLYDTPSGRVLQQNQGGRWVDMDPELVQAFSWDGSRDRPYGVPRASAALAEGLHDIDVQEEIDDITDQVARPRIVLGFPLYETIKMAEANSSVLIGQGVNTDGTARNATPVEWAFKMKIAGDAALDQLKGKNVLSYIKEGNLTTLDGSAGLAALDPVHAARRVRLITGLLQPLSLMNMHVGGTLAYSDTEWRVHAQQLEDLRAFVNGVLRWVADVHLRFTGCLSKCRVDTQAIQTSDALKDEQKRKIFIANELTLFDNGLKSDDDLAHDTTGSGVVDGEKLAKRSAAVPGTTGVDDPADPSPEPADPEPKPIPGKA